MKCNGGEAVVQILKANGIDRVFGLLGGSMLELFDAIYHDPGIEYIGARDERAAAHMADAPGAAKVGNLGVIGATGRQRAVAGKAVESGE